MLANALLPQRKVRRRRWKARRSIVFGNAIGDPAAAAIQNYESEQQIKQAQARLQPETITPYPAIQVDNTRPTIAPVSPVSSDYIVQDGSSTGTRDASSSQTALGSSDFNSADYNKTITDWAIKNGLQPPPADMTSVAALKNFAGTEYVRAEVAGGFRDQASADALAFQSLGGFQYLTGNLTADSQNYIAISLGGGDGGGFSLSNGTSTGQPLTPQQLVSWENQDELQMAAAPFVFAWTGGKELANGILSIGPKLEKGGQYQYASDMRKAAGLQSLFGQTQEAQESLNAAASMQASADQPIQPVFSYSQTEQPYIIPAGVTLAGLGVLNLGGDVVEGFGILAEPKPLVPSSVSLPLDVSDDAFVRFDPTKFDASIDDVGLQASFSGGKLWFTKYGDVKNITNATDLEQILYRQNLWDSTQGKFTDGATLRLLTNVPDAVPAGLTNMTNGVRQWRVLRDIRSTDLQTIKRLPGGD